MSDGGDPNAVIQLKIIDSIWKPLEQMLAKGRILVNRPALRMLLDELDDTLDLGLEGEPKARPPSFVVSHRVVKLLLGVVMEDDGLHEYFSRSSAKT
jgi:hypothetical protein